MEAFKNMEKDPDLHSKTNMLDVEIHARPQITDQRYR